MLMNLSVNSGADHDAVCGCFFTICQEIRGKLSGQLDDIVNAPILAQVPVKQIFAERRMRGEFFRLENFKNMSPVVKSSVLTN